MATKLVFVWAAVACMADVCGGSIQPEMLAHARDYGFMWWAHGWRGRSVEKTRVFCVQTNLYGFAFDVDRGTLTHLGGIENALPELEAAAQSNEVIFNLPRVELKISAEIHGRLYTVAAAAPTTDQVRIIEHGRFFQRIEMLGVDLRDSEGKPPEGVQARLEFACWPDRLAILVHLTCEDEGKLVRPQLLLHLPDSAQTTPLVDDRGRAWSVAHEKSVCGAMLRARGVEWVESRETPANDSEDTSSARPASGRSGLGVRASARWCENARTRPFAMVVLFARTRAELEQRIEQELNPREDVTVRARGTAPYTHPLAPAYDPADGCYRITLGDLARDGWTPVADPDRLERVALTVTNPSDEIRTARVQFSQPPADGRPGIIGLSPMLRDQHGYPIGLPVQISKNWHESDWLSASTILQLPPRSSTPLEFTIAYGNWGGVPAVSHAQLCLVGWGVNQLWHEVALGSFGEAICYDPDVNLNRAVIDDIRPLLVRRMGSRDSEPQPYGWTHNVGGGDFLVYFDQDGTRQFLSRMRTVYSRYCPNISEVTYAGHTQDGRIDARMTVQHYRSDDITRGIYHVRYDVKQPAPFQRLAFFQLGADHYNDHQFRTIARGDAGGVAEEWQPQLDGKGYARTGIACTGRTPWFSLHDGIRTPRRRGAWANRGLIIRNWRARLGGREQTNPIAGVHHTNDHMPSVLLELTPPHDLGQLEAGDFVEADLELIVLPMSQQDYLGPNASLREALGKHANTWRMVWREAVGNDLDVRASQGSVERAYPTRLRVETDGAAQIAIGGGIGYLPIMFCGVPDYRVGTAILLEQQESADGSWKAVDQRIHGNDFWQAEHQPRSRSWDLAFNVPADRQDPRTPLVLRLRRVENSSENNVVASRPAQ